MVSFYSRKSWGYHMAKELTSLAEVREYLQQDGLKILDLYAEWCQPCIRFLSIIDRVENALTPFGAEIAKCNANVHRDVFDEFKLGGFPTFLYYYNGQLQERYTGIKPIVMMQQIVDNIINRPTE